MVFVWLILYWYCTQKFHLDHLWEFWGLRLNIWAQLTPHNWNLTLTQITTDLLLIFFILTSTVIVPNKSKPKFKVIFLCQVLQCTILVNNSNPFVKVHCSVLFKSVVLFSLLTKHHPIFWREVRLTELSSVTLNSLPYIISVQLLETNRMRCSL